MLPGATRKQLGTYPKTAGDCPKFAESSEPNRTVAFSAAERSIIDESQSTGK